MALEISLRTRLNWDDDVLKLYVLDTTGNYNLALSATTGFGSPNPEVADITATELKITFPDENEYTVSMTLPDLTMVESEFTYEDITGNSGTFKDGVYKVNYSLTTNEPLTYTFSKQYLFYPNIQCCIYNKKLELTVESCGCDTAQNKDFLLADGLLESLKAAACNGDVAKFEVLLEVLEKACSMSTSGCKNC